MAEEWNSIDEHETIMHRTDSASIYEPLKRVETEPRPQGIKRLCDHCELRQYTSINSDAPIIQCLLQFQLPSLLQ